jgi:solute carrier family 26 (sodium-independent sulfate anion transporter), member 11
LIDDFKRRKQPLYFYRLRPSVIDVFKGAKIEDFVHFCDENELENYVESGKCLVKHNTVL